ncbi:MAG: hypothetical protein IIU28_03275 [Lachnospiraceae bacterium]|nr:hypothetical protein [Lachnospiraceae bacterium]
MNLSRLQEITQNYYDRFLEFNTPTEPNETFKWSIAKTFSTRLDEALKASNDRLIEELKNLAKETGDFIDSSRMQPFYGMAKIAEKDAALTMTVRQLLAFLIQAHDADVPTKVERIHFFNEEMLKLHKMHFPHQYNYAMDLPAATSILLLYDPDHNYMYKPTTSRAFADALEYYDDWGSGSTLKLDMYFRFCEEVMAQLKDDPNLAQIDRMRFFQLRYEPEALHPDANRHILLADLMHCTGAYNLCPAMADTQITAKKRKEFKEKLEIKEQAVKQLDELQADVEALDSAYDTIVSLLNDTPTILHKKYGKGTVTHYETNPVRKNDKIHITLEDGKEVKLGYQALTLKTIPFRLENDEKNLIFDLNCALLRNEASIRANYQRMSDQLN